MKKYNTPEINITELEPVDVIQTSVIQETPEALGRKGFNIGTVEADNINLFD